MKVWTSLPHKFSLGQNGTVKFFTELKVWEETHVHISKAGVVWADFGHDCRPATAQDFLYYYMLRRTEESFTQEMSFQDVVDDFNNE